MQSDSRVTTVMIVDDIPENLQILQTMLHDEGYRVRAFRHGEAALDGARRVAPDLMLLDIMMPGMDGYELCRKVKDEPALTDVPVIFLSARTDSDAKVRAFAEGGVDYITKPFAAEEVLARVRTHLLLRRQKQGLADAYQALQVLEEQRDQLVHMTIHDLRSPLTAVYSILQSFFRGEIPHEESRETALEGVRATRRAIDLITLVLDVRRLEDGALPLSLAPVDLGELLRSTVHELRHLVGRRTLVEVVPETPLHARCDESLLRRVIQNMLDNAVRHTDREQGRIEVEVTETEHQGRREVMVCIRDNGPGVPREHQQSIFGKYGQVKSGDHTSGLGLAFCKMVVDAHGGRIGVESDGAAGRGSTFWWTIPVVPVVPGEANT